MFAAYSASPVQDLGRSHMFRFRSASSFVKYSQVPAERKRGRVTYAPDFDGTWKPNSERRVLYRADSCNVSRRCLHQPRVQVTTSSNGTTPKQGKSSGRGGGPLKRLLSPVIHYSNDRSLADPEQIQSLWAATLGRQASLELVSRAIDNSYAVMVALVYEKEAEGRLGLLPGGFRKNWKENARVVGFARSISDGAFVACICDVAVLPAYQQQGIGRRLVRRLVAEMAGGPSSFAVFPAPHRRQFFFNCGFRLSHRFMIMKYKLDDLADGRSGDESPSSSINGSPFTDALALRSQVSSSPSSPSPSASDDPNAVTRNNNSLDVSASTQEAPEESDGGTPDVGASSSGMGVGEGAESLEASKGSKKDPKEIPWIFRP